MGLKKKMVHMTLKDSSRVSRVPRHLYSNFAQEQIEAYLEGNISLQNAKLDELEEGLHKVAEKVKEVIRCTADSDDHSQDFD